MSDVVQLDTTKPNIARVYDYMLGGKDNFAADRVTGYASRVAAGSWIVVSVGTTDDAELLDRARGSYTLSAWNHGPREMAAWLAGLTLAPPGMSEARRWISQVGGVPRANEGSWYILCAAAVKPG